MKLKLCCVLVVGALSATAFAATPAGAGDSGLLPLGPRVLCLSEAGVLGLGLAAPALLVPGLNVLAGGALFVGGFAGGYGTCELRLAQASAITAQTKANFESEIKQAKKAIEEMISVAAEEGQEDLLAAARAAVKNVDEAAVRVDARGAMNAKALDEIRKIAESEIRRLVEEFRSSKFVIDEEQITKKGDEEEGAVFWRKAERIRKEKEKLVRDNDSKPGVPPLPPPDDLIERRLP